MFCKKCGEEAKPGVKFCRHCGTEFVLDSSGQTTSDKNTATRANIQKGYQALCPKCGKENNPGVKYCRYCGAALVSYTKDISRKDPGCFLFLIDQSESMADPFGMDKGKQKSQGVADAINNILNQLVNMCTKGFEVRDYFFVGVIGYGASVGSALGGNLAGRYLLPLSEINGNARVIERTSEDEGRGGDKPIKLPIWIDPVAQNGTPMCAALKEARRVLSGWVSQYPGSYPPIVINITDGESNDGDPLPEARRLTNISTTDGKVLLFNCHLSSNQAPSILFPDSSAGLPDIYARTLFDMSSILPEKMRVEAQTQGLSFNKETRGFAFNAGIAELIQLLDIGTKGNQQKSPQH